MEELCLILFGWLLGLLSPTVTGVIKNRNERKILFSAICTESKDLQYRVAITSYDIMKKYGDLSKDYIIWLKQIVSHYSGSESKTVFEDVLTKFSNFNEEEIENVKPYIKQKEGVMVFLKHVEMTFVENNLFRLVLLPVELQQYIHEVRNHVSILNQSIKRIDEYFFMTFDSSFSDENSNRLNENITREYSDILDRYIIIADKLQLILDYQI